MHVVLDGALPEREAAQKLKYHPEYLAQLRRDGRGPAYVRRGRSIFYTVADLEAFLEKHAAGGR